MTNTVKFPMDGFEDSCNGYKVPEHGSNAVIDGLCMDCSRKLQIECAEADQAARARRLGNLCPGGCNGHSHGSRYYDCICCYGD